MELWHAKLHLNKTNKLKAHKFFENLSSNFAKMILHVFAKNILARFTNLKYSNLISIKYKIPGPQMLSNCRV